jgi:hypothetical protein
MREIKGKTKQTKRGETNETKKLLAKLFRERERETYIIIKIDGSSGS